MNPFETHIGGLESSLTNATDNIIDYNILKEFQISRDVVLAIRKFLEKDISNKEVHDTSLCTLATTFYVNFPELVRTDPITDQSIDIVFVIHYYHAFILNLEAFHDKFKTSIFCYKSVNLANLLKKIKRDYLFTLGKNLKNIAENAQDFHPLYDQKWQVCSYPVLKDNDLSNLGNFFFPIDLIEISILGKGKFDIYIVSFLCYTLNKLFFEEKIFLTPWVFNTQVFKNSSFLAGFASVAVEHTKRVRKHPGFTDEIFQVYKKNLCDLSNPQKIVEDIKLIQKDLKEIMSKSTKNDLKKIEEYLVSAIGCENSRISKYASNA